MLIERIPLLGTKDATAPAHMLANHLPVGAAVTRM